MTPHQEFWTPEEIQRVIEYRQQGLSAATIGERLHRTPRSIEALVKRRKLPRSNYVPKPPGATPKQDARHARQRQYRQQLKLHHANVQRAGATTLPPLPSLQEPIHVIRLEP